MLRWSSRKQTPIIFRQLQDNERMFAEMRIDCENEIDFVLERRC